MNADRSPNLFDYATKELSQDAMICWLLKWSEQQHQGQDGALHTCGVQFVHELMRKHGAALQGDINEVEIHRQVRSDRHTRIDILVRINSQHVLLIEDKTSAREHNNQLLRYYQSVIEGRTPFNQVAEENVYPIYLKTGNQSLVKDCRIESALTGKNVAVRDYGVFSRANFLDVLNCYNGHNTTLSDFRQHLQDIEDKTNSYTEWKQDTARKSWYAWEGFYRRLECELNTCAYRSSGWHYVPNPSGGFLGFWWCPSDRSDLYLQIETVPGKKTNLCFKVNAEGKTNDQRQSFRKYWRKQVIAAGNAKVKKAGGLGNHMTVARWMDNWLAFRADGALDIPNTVGNLRQAEEVLRDAVS